MVTPLPNGAHLVAGTTPGTFCHVEQGRCSCVESSLSGNCRHLRAVRDDLNIDEPRSTVDDGERVSFAEWQQYRRDGREGW